ncbi:hypothetical protein BDM02DRAFT_3127458 [Thelephora ganbajun]|uniref:Uncharacterized protein n=1 Tax=Thelephora ganbajun TaxID=370292 RepID=A0ACB6ZLV2_THEGA|nr:hypothetical protein BDM02DRAFT_3127458 [Thelephora ganbajun]
MQDSQVWLRLMKKIKDVRERLLSGPLAMPSWIYVAPGSVSSIVSALDYWLKTTPKKTVKGILEHHELKSPLDLHDSFLGMAGVSTAYKEMVQSTRSRAEQQVAAVVDGFSDADLQAQDICPPGLSMSEARKFIKKFMVDEFLNDQGAGGSRGSDIFEKEMDWYKEMNCFYPPRELEKRHFGLAALKKQVMEQEAKGQHPNPDKQVVYAADKEYYETWKPNITLFDPTADDYDSRYIKGYPKLSMDFFSTIKAFRTCYDTFELGEGGPELEPHRISYGYVSRVFEAAAEAILALSSKAFSSGIDREGDRGRGGIAVEVICGELIDELRKMKLHDLALRSGGDLDPHGLSSRPEHFPNSYVRIWMSNIPDYTHGLITTAVYVLPVLRTDTEDAAIASNCVLNTGAFKDDDEFIHTYTLLTPTDVPGFLGCRIINSRALADVLSVGHVKPGPPSPIKDLATRGELIRWLDRQLVNTLSPGKPHQGMVRVRSPNNMVAFVNLLVRLCDLGFPAHWISDYVQSMLMDKVVTRAVPARELPIPVSDIHSSQQGADRKLGLGPWIAELEAVLASVRKGLPFFVSLPADDGIVVASELEDVGKFEAKIRSFAELRLMQHIFSPFDPVANLLFWKPSPSSGRNDQALKKEGEKIIEQEIDGVLSSSVGQQSSKWNGKFLVLTAQESMGQDKSVSWRMAKKRVERMRTEGWVMMVVTSDFRVAVTKPVPASEWWEVQDLD